VTDELALSLAVRASQQLEQVRVHLCNERVAARMRAADSIGPLAASAVSEPAEPTEAEWARAAGLCSIMALRDTLAAGYKARSTLVTRNIGLAIAMATRATSRAGGAMTLADLVQEGASGLLRATETFEPARGYKFSTYAHSWVRVSIERAIQNEARTVRVPVWLYGVQSKVLAARAGLHLLGVAMPTEEQLAQHSGQPLKKVRAVLTQFCGQSSLDAKLEAAGDVMASTSALEDALLAERDADAARAHTDLMDLLDTVLNEERLVLRAHFGLNGSAKELPVTQIAEQLGLRKSAVAALLKSGLSKLRQPERLRLLPALSQR
jgi:RNA polymerase sigma factor (sigma-70 family)